MLASIFFNYQQHRLRAGWRLLLQGIIYLGGLMLFNILIGIVLGIFILLSGGNLSNPQAIMALANGSLVQVAMAVLSLLLMFVSYWIASRWLDKRPFKSYGFHFGTHWWADFGFGLVLGAVLMLLIFMVERSMGWITVTGTLHSATQGGFWIGILAYGVTFFCVGIYEEMLSRGYQLRNLAEGFNFKPFNPRLALLLAYLISSSVFGMLHLFNANASLVSTLNLVIAGLFLGLGYVLTGELALPIGLHMSWNFFQGNVFGFPVSGMKTGASFIGIQQAGPQLWTGGAFGPEAGLIGLAAIALGSLLIVLWVRWHYGQLHLRDALAIYQPDIHTPVRETPLQEGELHPAIERTGD